MTFTWEDNTYHIEFQRAYKQVRVGVIDGVDIFKSSRYPYTTVLIWKSGPKIIPDLFRTATVGCWSNEKQFTLEKGRLNALRLVGRTLDKGFKKAMWKAYSERDHKV